MKLIYTNIKKGEVKAKVENLDDLWCLSTIVDQGDIVKGKTLRKITLGSKEERKQKAIKKPVFLAIKVEKVEFSTTLPILRILGVIVEGPEDIARGEHHSFQVEEHSIITIVKEQWLKFQLDRLKEASQERASRSMVVVFDREEAYFALMKRYGYELLLHLKGDVAKKGYEEKKSGNFYREIINAMSSYSDRYELNQIILASPAFWKEELLKELDDEELKKKIIQATCSSVDRQSIQEVLKRPETQTALKHDRIAKETALVEKLLVEIAKDSLAAYGFKEVGNAAEAGAIKELLVTDSFIQQSREANNYLKLESLMKIVEAAKGNITIISHEHDGGKKLDGLGGIGCLLRYRVSY